jgi:hypothetical protein
MTADQVLIAHLIKALVLLALVGILWRGRAHLCWSFVAYLLTALICNSLFSFWPERFFHNWFWILQQGLDDAFKMAVATELGFRIFQAFPAAQATSRRVLFVLLVATSVALIGIPTAATYGQVALEWQPRVLTGTIWLMNGLALLITWYRVPVHAYHKAILLGFVPYLLVFTTIQTLIKQHDWLFSTVQSAEPAVFMLLVAFWAWAAWKPEPEPDVSPALLQFLQPWREKKTKPSPSWTRSSAVARLLQPWKA